MKSVENVLCRMDSWDVCFFSSVYIEHGSREESSVSSFVDIACMISFKIGIDRVPYLKNVLRPLRIRYARNLLRNRISCTVVCASAVPA